MEYRGGQCRIDIRQFENIDKMLNPASSTGSHQWHLANRPNGTQLRDIVTIAGSVAAHAIQYDFSGATLLHFRNPFECRLGKRLRLVRVAGKLPDAPLPVHQHYVSARKERD